MFEIYSKHSLNSMFVLVYEPWQTAVKLKKLFSLIRKTLICVLQMHNIVTWVAATMCRMNLLMSDFQNCVFLNVTFNLMYNLVFNG